MSESRPIVGSLITVFTPPSYCTQVRITYTGVVESRYVQFVGQPYSPCGAASNLNQNPCYPPSTSTYSNSLRLYSPAFECPSGWNPRYTLKQPAPGGTPIWFDTSGFQVSGFATELTAEIPFNNLKEGETKIVCCPK